MNLRTISKMNLGKKFRAHTSTIILILANLLTIVFAIVQKWDIGNVIWIYWAQSLIIGFFNFFHILDLKKFSTEEYTEIRPRAKISIKSQMALFFIFHYGLLHIIFLVFLLDVWGILPNMSVLSFVLCILAFFGTHGFAYWESRKKVAETKPSIVDVVFYPYARVLPMWFTLTLGIYYGQGSLHTLVLFLLLKTFADVAMHIMEIENMMIYNRNTSISTSPNEEKKEELLEVDQADHCKQYEPLGIWQRFKNGIEAWYGPGVLKSRQGILYLIVIIALAIFCLYFLLTLPSGGVPGP